MAKDSPPFKITLDLFCPEGLLILKSRHDAFLESARTQAEKRRVIERAIVELVYLADLAKAELAKANPNTPLPAHVEEVYDQLVEIDLAIRNWHLIAESLPNDKGTTTTRKPKLRPTVTVDFDAMGPTLTKEQVIAICGRSESWVEKRTAEDRIPGIKRAVGGRRVVYDKAVIQQWHKDNFPLKPRRE